jgi:hypothetical protein
MPSDEIRDFISTEGPGLKPVQMYLLVGGVWDSGKTWTYSVDDVQDMVDKALAHGHKRGCEAESKKAEERIEDLRKWAEQQGDEADRQDSNQRGYECDLSYSGKATAFRAVIDWLESKSDIKEVKG